MAKSKSSADQGIKLEDWKKSSEKQQESLQYVLGDRYWDRFEMVSHKPQLFQKITFSIFGDSQERSVSRETIWSGVKSFFSSKSKENTNVQPDLDEVANEYMNENNSANVDTQIDQLAKIFKLNEDQKSLIL